MILIGLGGNLPSNAGAPDATIGAAIDALRAAGVRIEARSRDYRSAPTPPSDQPWYINAVIAVATDLPPRELLALLHRIEARFGRVRREVNGARPLDLDLLAYDERVQASGEGEPDLPHPRLHHRAFVLLPLAEVAPGWRHPITGDTVEYLIAALPPE
ncbi:MAG TPA: 2-amino-4-hydroxy-6-hydroxymethyldihydropteridine diphosphokinase, partial [Stellaceae bacterium]